MDPSIDALLERYLGLLDEYTTLRADLARLQTSMFQNLARANFSAERGLRYGPDFFDARMQASRRVQLIGAGDVPTYRIACGGGDDAGTDADARNAGGAPAARDGDAQPGSKQDLVSDDESAEDKEQRQPPSDPIRWFGVLTPLALRQTQSCAVDAVDKVIPRLLSVDAAMKDLEIQVRRARKRRAKAEAAAAAAAAAAAVSKDVQGPEQAVSDEIIVS